MHQQSLAVGGILRAEFRRVFAPAVHVTIDRVIDDFDFLIDIENPHRSVAQVIGDGSDSVALIDGIARNGQIGPVQPDERNICAMQRGDEWQPAPAGAIGQHLPRQQRAHRVRDGIVDVQNREDSRTTDTAILQLRDSECSVPHPLAGSAGHRR